MRLKSIVAAVAMLPMISVANAQNVESNPSTTTLAAREELAVAFAKICVSNPAGLKRHADDPAHVPLRMAYNDAGVMQGCLDAIKPSGNASLAFRAAIDDMKEEVRNVCTASAYNLQLRKHVDDPAKNKLFSDDGLMFWECLNGVAMRASVLNPR